MLNVLNSGRKEPSPTGEGSSLKKWVEEEVKNKSLMEKEDPEEEGFKFREIFFLLPLSY